MSLPLALWVIFHVGFIAFLWGAHRGRRRGRFEMAALVEERYGPLIEQLEQLADSTDRLGAELAGEAQQQIEAIRKASPWN
jgi:hypothetical protein